MYEEEGKLVPDVVTVKAPYGRIDDLPCVIESVWDAPHSLHQVGVVEDV